MSWLNKYPDGGKLPKPKEKKFSLRNDPLRPQGLGVQTQDNLRLLPLYSPLEISNAENLKKIQNSPRIGMAKQQSIPQQQLTKLKKEAYAASQPNAKLVNGQLEEINPGYKMEGQPFGPNEKRFDKGLDHIAGGLEAATYITGAGELYGAAKPFVKAGLEQAGRYRKGFITKVPKPTSTQQVVSTSSGMDAVYAKQPGYNSHLFNKQGYVPPTTDPNLMTYKSSYNQFSESTLKEIRELSKKKKAPFLTKLIGETLSPAGIAVTEAGRQVISKITENESKEEKKINDAIFNVVPGLKKESNSILNSKWLNKHK